MYLLDNKSFVYRSNCTLLFSITSGANLFSNIDFLTNVGTLFLP